MPTTQVQLYKLSALTQLINGVVLRTTMIDMSPAPGTPVAVVHLFYVPANVVGYFFGNELAAYFPRAELDTHLQLLQTESPLWISWELDPPANPTVVNQFALSTGEEYPGEGFADLSP